MSWQAFDTAASHFIPSSDLPGLQLHLRAHGDAPERMPVLFVHGATYASRLYDVPAPGASWVRATAEAGFAAYALDIRGYGKSHVPGLANMAQPFARGQDAVRDIADATDWLRARHGTDQIALIGGSWGSITTAMFAAGRGAGRVSALVLYAPIFAAPNPGWLDFLSDPQDRSRFNPAFTGARPVGEASTRARWDAEIPEGAGWRDEAVFQALVQSSQADDPDAALRTPPAFLAPNGTLCDLWEAFNARPLYDPAAIHCPTLLIRGGADTTATRADALNLMDHLGTPHKRYAELAGGAHFASAEQLGPEIFRMTHCFLEDWARPHVAPQQNHA